MTALDAEPYAPAMTQDNPALSGRPVILVHLEDPPGSGFTACSGQPFTPAADTDFPNVPRVLCQSCDRAAAIGRTINVPE
jgi:hypothetical protein